MITASGQALHGAGYPWCGGPAQSGEGLPRTNSARIPSSTSTKIETAACSPPIRQTGLVMGLSHFRHPMTNLPYKVKTLGRQGNRTQPGRTCRSHPFDLPAAHIFKVGPGGLVHEIEAMGFTVPYNSPTRWE